MLIRYTDEKTFLQAGKVRYYGDCVFNRRRDAEMRKSQLDRANYYSIITEKEGVNGTEFSVWKTKSDRKGTSATKIEKIRELPKEGGRRVVKKK